MKVDQFVSFRAKLEKFSKFQPIDNGIGTMAAVSPESAEAED